MSLTTPFPYNLTNWTDGLGTQVRKNFEWLGSPDGSSCVGFLQSGTGATAQNLQAWGRNRPILVSDFNNATSGSDITTALQDACNKANGSGRTVIVPFASATISSNISLNNYSDFIIDFGQCAVTFTGSAGTYLFDMTQAGEIEFRGGQFTGTSNGNHFVKTIGSAAALATTFPTVPADNQWARRLTFNIGYVQTFGTVFDLQSFSREIWINANCSGNTNTLKITGKVVNLWADDSILYSRVASSQAVLIRGDSGDTAYRYAEGVFLENCICDTSGTAVDIQDALDLRFRGGQIKSPAGVTGCAITKGITTITQDFLLSDIYFNAGFVIGTGLGTNFLFQAKVNNCVFSAVQDIAIETKQFTQGFTTSNCSFDNPSGTKTAIKIGANNAAIRIDNPHISSDHTTNVSIDSTSVSAVRGHFPLSYTPTIAFGGASVGVTYTTQIGRAQWCEAFVMGSFDIVLSAKGSSTGAVTIGGLPVTSTNKGSATAGDFSSFNTALTPVLGIAANGTSIAVKTGASGSATAFTDLDVANTTAISGTFMYQVST